MNNTSWVVYLTIKVIIELILFITIMAAKLITVEIFLGVEQNGHFAPLE